MVLPQARSIRNGVTDASGTETADAYTSSVHSIAHANIKRSETLVGTGLWGEIEGWDSRILHKRWLLVDTLGRYM